LSSRLLFSVPLVLSSLLLSSLPPVSPQASFMLFSFLPIFGSL
jgi:hypothetical protein